MTRFIGERLRVLYPSGGIAYYATQQQARELLRAGLAQPIGTKTKIKTVQLVDGPARPVAGTKYSHRSELDDNPHGVYALRQILHIDRALFVQVQTDCLVTA